SGSTLGANSGVDIGDVTINNAAGASAVNIQDGGNSLTVDATQLDVDDLSHTTDSVSLGDGTNTLGSSNTASGYALLVNDMNGPQIGSKSFTYASDNDMAATDTITITGLAKDVVLQALNGDCTFDIDGGNSIVVRKNTAEDFDFA
ncbi:MAG: hypothetical protein GTO63_16545, partial [Anaerolineae bacterium]|nr:hypothetical protein [Anaerolineae bacterium]NIN96420.1 hypothetical protein [Anaerolineae bacterium]NIQ79456.1 hypothetical protein [Anaerolineae bacterium]